MLIRGLSRDTLRPILRSHGWSCLAPLEAADSSFRYPLLLNTRTAIAVEVTGLAGSLRIRADRPLTPGQRNQLVACVKHMLSLDFPLGDLLTMCKAKKAAPLLRLVRHGWGRMLRSPTFWEDAVKTLCTTNASWGYTLKMCGNLCAVLGHATGSGMKTMPMPGDVLKAGERVLVEDVGMGYRSKSLTGLAERAASREAPWLLDTSQKPDAATAEREIASWHGFGKYATRHLLVLMGFHEYLPIDREVGSHLRIRKPGDKGGNLDCRHFQDWGPFRFTAYKLTRVAERNNWIGD